MKATNITTFTLSVIVTADTTTFFSAADIDSILLQRKHWRNDINRQSSTFVSAFRSPSKQTHLIYKFYLYRVVTQYSTIEYNIIVQLLLTSCLKAITLVLNVSYFIIQISVCLQKRTEKLLLIFMQMFKISK